MTNGKEELRSIIKQVNQGSDVITVMTKDDENAVIMSESVLWYGSNLSSFLTNL